jgi:oligopeptide/dipeptide ABC transporter ATP-binding protein
MIETVRWLETKIMPDRMSVNGRKNVLQVSGLKTYFFTPEGVVRAVDGVDFCVGRGEILGIVGESGCGKSVTLLSVMRLISAPGEIVAGSVTFDGQNLLDLPEAEMVRMRGNRFSMIFQQPIGCLNPVLQVGDQIAEVLHVHQGLSKKAGWERAVALMRLVDLPQPERKVRAYAHELSGGQAQRVMMAMALACCPDLLIADEPTTALDVTIQAQILDLIRDLQSKTATSIILVTHDLGVVAETVERVIVMYAGRFVEQADVHTLFRAPRHPYTQGLMASIPVSGVVRENLTTIPGSVPDLINTPPGCKFAPRCQARVENRLEICTQQEPALVAIAAGHQVRCWLYG